jgi:hypothetical protein
MEKSDESRTRRDEQGRKYSKMDKRAKDKREWRGIGCRKRSSLKNWKGREEGEDPGKEGKRKYKEIFKCWEREYGESWWQIGKNGRTLFDRPKPTVGCSANVRRRRRHRNSLQKLVVQVSVSCKLAPSQS